MMAIAHLMTIGFVGPSAAAALRVFGQTAVFDQTAGDRFKNLMQLPKETTGQNDFYKDSQWNENAQDCPNLLALIGARYNSVLFQATYERLPTNEAKARFPTCPGFWFEVYKSRYARKVDGVMVKYIEFQLWCELDQKTGKDTKPWRVTKIQICRPEIDEEPYLYMYTYTYQESGVPGVLFEAMPDGVKIKYRDTLRLMESVGVVKFAIDYTKAGLFQLNMIPVVASPYSNSSSPQPRCHQSPSCSPSCNQWGSPSQSCSPPPSNYSQQPAGLVASQCGERLPAYAPGVNAQSPQAPAYSASGVSQHRNGDVPRSPPLNYSQQSAGLSSSQCREQLPAYAQRVNAQSPQPPAYNALSQQRNGDVPQIVNAQSPQPPAYNFSGVSQQRNGDVPQIVNAQSPQPLAYITSGVSQQRNGDVPQIWENPRAADIATPLMDLAGMFYLKAPHEEVEFEGPEDRKYVANCKVVYERCSSIRWVTIKIARTNAGSGEYFEGVFGHDSNNGNVWPVPDQNKYVPGRTDRTGWWTKDNLPPYWNGIVAAATSELEKKLEAKKKLEAQGTVR